MIKFIGDLLSKGYATASSEPRLEGKAWYIPYHGVYHSSKPGNIRVEFDCSAEFNDKSINKALIRGPYLTNQLIGVLKRFRQGHVSFIGDIESMFYQLLLTGENRSFLRFLWWKDGDLNRKPFDYENSLHVFGTVSSPRCSNYILKKTAVNNKPKFENEADNILTRDFYVNDMLKPVPSIPETA